MKYTFAPMISMDNCETDYLTKILNKLEDVSDDYHFIVARTNNPQEIEQFRGTIRDGKKNVMLMLSDEAGIIPPFLDKLHKVFRTYNHKRLYDEKKIFPIPCGYCAQLGMKSLPKPESKYIYAEQEHKPIEERKYELFFSGQLGPNRSQMAQQLMMIKDNFKSYVQITGGFGQGFCTEEYFKVLNETKIAIVPNGAVVPESFRYFESFESGCIVISSYPFENPNFNHWYYQNSPAIKIKNWGDLTIEFINTLLEKEDELHKKSKEYYNNYLSSESVSNYIKNNLE